MKKLIITITLCACMCQLHAQTDKKKTTKGGMGYFRVGYNLLDFSSLNSRLQTYNIPVPNTLALNTGGGGYGILKNWLIGGEGYGFMSQNNEDTSYNVKTDGGSGSFQLGYVVFHRDKLNIIPILGIGGYHIDVNIDEKLEAPYFDLLLSDPGNSTLLTTTGTKLTAKLMTNFKVGKFFWMGIEAGYNYSVSTKGSWKYNGRTVTSGPYTNLDGLFFGISIGGGMIGD